MPDVDEPIRLVEYDPVWPALFEAEAARVRAALSELELRIEHVGSTAVPALCGKSIVDLLVGTRTWDEAKRVGPRVVALGYEDFGELFLPGRLYLRRRGPPDYNVAITVIGSTFFANQLAVRDFLRTHPDELWAYAQAKRAAVADGAQMFSSYSQHKQLFVEALIARALKWARETGSMR